MMIVWVICGVDPTIAQIIFILMLTAAMIQTNYKIEIKLNWILKHLKYLLVLLETAETDLLHLAPYIFNFPYTYWNMLRYNDWYSWKESFWLVSKILVLFRRPSNAGASKSLILLGEDSFQILAFPVISFISILAMIHW